MSLKKATIATLTVLNLLALHSLVATGEAAARFDPCFPEPNGGGSQWCHCGDFEENECMEAIVQVTVNCFATHHCEP